MLDYIFIRASSLPISLQRAQGVIGILKERVSL